MVWITVHIHDTIPRYGNNASRESSPNNISLVHVIKIEPTEDLVTQSVNEQTDMLMKIFRIFPATYGNS